MLKFLLIAVIILLIAVIGILIYLWWLPIKIKRISNQCIDENDAINEEEIEIEEEEEDD